MYIQSMKASKKFSLLKTVSLFAFMLITAGCASAGRELIVSENSPIALALITANYDINWKDEEKTVASGTGKTLRRMMRVDPDWTVITKSEGIIDEIEQTIYNTLNGSPLISLAPKEDVLNSQAYNEAKTTPIRESREMVKPSGYRFVVSRDKDFRAKFANETGIQKTFYIALKLTKAMASGFGKNGKGLANVAMTMTIKDIQGKNLWNKTYEIRSLDRFKVTSGAYSEEELLALFPPMIKDICLDFLEDLEY
ncbi:putative lipoprotein [Leadbettera azotonutricia ZAS-9]|uniref:Putative lipoprotein n=2 Tax=Leadbettera azotonutricia TaxID=150829 RepID=F5Y9H2_LEAAZ|nr:putative lipoprotein [Leadbettera azotonutricia ZAS-9]